MKDRLLGLARLLLILVGVGILVYPSLSEYLSEVHGSRTTASYDDSVRKLQQQQLDELRAEAQEYNRQLAEQGNQTDSIDNRESEDKNTAYWQLLNLDSTGMMGYITIPRLNTTIPIYHGTAESVLQVGVGHVMTTSLPVGGENTHAALSGHAATLDVTYTVVDAYRAYDCDWDAATASDRLALAKKLAKVAVPDKTGVTDHNGKLTFSSLKPGLYLVVRCDVAEGNEAYILDPYLVTLPSIEDGVVYKNIEVDEKFAKVDPVSPKPSPEPTVEPPAKVPAKPSVQPSMPDKLFQTGQLKWPIPVLLTLGMALMLLGAWLQRKSRHEK